MSLTQEEINLQNGVPFYGDRPDRIHQSAKGNFYKIQGGKKRYMENSHNVSGKVINKINIHIGDKKGKKGRRVKEKNKKAKVKYTHNVLGPNGMTSVINNNNNSFQLPSLYEYNPTKFIPTVGNNERQSVVQGFVIPPPQATVIMTTPASSSAPSHPSATIHLSNNEPSRHEPIIGNREHSFDRQLPSFSNAKPILESASHITSRPIMLRNELPSPVDLSGIDHKFNRAPPSLFSRPITNNPSINNKPSPIVKENEESIFHSQPPNISLQPDNAEFTPPSAGEPSSAPRIVNLTKKIEKKDIPEIPYIDMDIEKKSTKRGRDEGDVEEPKANNTETKLTTYDENIAKEQAKRRENAKPIVPPSAKKKKIDYDFGFPYGPEREESMSESKEEPPVIPKKESDLEKKRRKVAEAAQTRAKRQTDGHKPKQTKKPSELTRDVEYATQEDSPEVVQEMLSKMSPEDREAYLDNKKKVDRERKLDDKAKTQLKEQRRLEKAEKAKQAAIARRLKEQQEREELKQSGGKRNGYKLKKQNGAGINTGLFNDEITKILRHKVKHNLVPVVPSDFVNTLPKFIKPNQKVFGAILNTNPSTSDGSGKDGYNVGHWTSMIIDNRDDHPSIEFFDPLVEGPPSEDLLRAAKQIAERMNPEKMFLIKQNAIQRQSNNASSCGLHSVKFIEDRMRGRSWADSSGYTHWLSTKNPSKDDSKEGEAEMTPLKKEYKHYL